DLLVRADQQMRELAARGARLDQQLRDCRLQNVFREQESRLQRDLCRSPGGGCGAAAFDVRVFIQKPTWAALENRGKQIEQLLRGSTLAALDHAQVGNGRRQVNITLDAAGRQLLERETVPLADRAQLGTEEVSFAKQRRHDALLTQAVTWQS